MSAEERAEDTAAPTAPSAAAGRGSLLPWIVAVVAILVAAFSTFQWLTLQGQADTRAAVQRTAEEFMVALTNWDASDGLQDTRDALKAAGTGDFVGEVDELFGGTLGADLEAAAAVSTGEVQDVFVQRIEGDEAVALGVVVQELTTNLTDEPDRTVRSARLTLQRVDGAWLVSNVQLLVDDTATDAVADAPTTEPTAQPTGEPTSDEEPTS